ncbi:hypothetical protein KUTeg_014520 [Tegillarca granosa]|uniref:Uncharacterized protein n=1 Tax=Tegillarca granosa TaxID=220873 RepID=A0ABQ9EW13_TEGGR|nr:hypothetical protein KUTeg_014520 [Tegillarca granosa]
MKIFFFFRKSQVILRCASSVNFTFFGEYPIQTYTFELACPEACLKLKPTSVSTGTVLLIM